MVRAVSGPDGRALDRAYARDGYVLVRGVVGAGEVARLRALVTEAFARLRGARRFLLPTEVLAIEELATVPFAPRVVETLRAVLEPGFATFADLCVQREMFGTWHTDADSEGARRYLYAPGYRNAKCGLFLQDNDAVRGGGIDVLAGGHRFLPAPGRRARFLLKRLRDRAGTLLFGEALPIRAGDLVIFDSRLPHRSTPRRAASPEPKYVLYWNACRARWADEYIAHNARRAAREEREERFWSDYLPLRFPEDFPPAYVTAAGRAGAFVATAARPRP